MSSEIVFLKMTNRNKQLGRIREKRAQAYLEKNYGWYVQKTNLGIDKYHYIDFQCINSKNELCYVQVKGYSFLKRKPAQKAIEYAKKHNGTLYYCFVPKKYLGNIFLKKIYESEN